MMFNRVLRNVGQNNRNSVVEMNQGSIFAPLFPVTHIKNFKTLMLTAGSSSHDVAAFLGHTKIGEL